MILARKHSQTNFSDDLQIKMQSVFRPLPFVERKRRKRRAFIETIFAHNFTVFSELFFGKPLEKQIVNVAITPIFARLEGFDDRVIRRMKMLCRVPVFRRIAAADVPARLAKAQVNPKIARFQAILAPVRARLDIFDFV
jgi:hypothetical protein